MQYTYPGLGLGASLLVLALSGCAGMTPMPSADQVRSVADGSNANVLFIRVTGTFGQAEVRALNTDKGSLGTNGGSASMDANGVINITVNPRPVPPVAKP